MLGVYTERSQNCEQVKAEFDRAGLVTQNRSYFFGCATGVTSHKLG
ncbi:MAG TPA: hypothetical protein VH092_34355 [Urbifossiella sp.]|jgi:hypothetical protein|nr:hypothetical protein [Urbifossiella sp.]